MDNLEMFPATSEQYATFVNKFKPKLTTDDCYTPAPVYDAVAEWVATRYGVDRDRFVRPFYPGGDFLHFDYPENCVVVDNPPFSILSEIVAFYTARGVRFFLFAPALVLFNYLRMPGVCALPVGGAIEYANGAIVPTSFLTNLDTASVSVEPDLYRVVKMANDAAKPPTVELPKYDYPDEVITAAICQRWCKYGVPFRAEPTDCVFTRALDAQKEQGKAIFGAGLLLRPEAAAERAAAHKWELSDRERGMLGMALEDQTTLFDARRENYG